MTIEIDYAEALQDRYALRQLNSKRFFVSVNRGHGSQCRPALHKQQATDDDCGATD